MSKFSQTHLLRIRHIAVFQGNSAHKVVVVGSSSPGKQRPYIHSISHHVKISIIMGHLE